MSRGIATVAGLFLAVSVSSRMPLEVPWSATLFDVPDRAASSQVAARWADAGRALSVRAGDEWTDRSLQGLPSTLSRWARMAAAEAAFLSEATSSPAPAAGVDPAYWQVLDASRRLRDYSPIPTANWAGIHAATYLPLHQYGWGHAHRLAVLGTLVDRSLGRDLAQENFRRARRTGQTDELARSLLLLGIIAREQEQHDAARALTTRAASVAARSASVRLRIAATAQLQDFDVSTTSAQLPPCDAVSRRTRSWGDCMRILLRTKWRESETEAAMFLYRQLVGAPFKKPGELTEDLIVAGPLLIAMGRLDEFDRKIEPALEDARQAHVPGAEAELWMLVSLAARIREQPPMASRALASAREAALDSDQLSRIELAEARIAYEDGNLDLARQGLRRVRAARRDATQALPDARMLAAQLGEPVEVGQRGGDRTSPVGALQSAVEARIRSLEPSSHKPRLASTRLTADWAEDWASRAGSERSSALAVLAETWASDSRRLAHGGEARWAAVVADTLRGGMTTLAELAELQSQIRPDTAVIVHAELDGDFWWWGITDRNVAMGRSDESAYQVRARVARYAAALRAPETVGASAAQDLGAELTEILIQPALRGTQATGSNRLVVIPAPGMAEIPFDTLPVVRQRSRAIRDVYVTSLSTSLYDLNAALRLQARDGRRIGFVPRAGRDPLVESRALSGHGFTTFWGVRATRTRFLSAVRGAALVHFGGHVSVGTGSGDASLTFSRHEVVYGADLLGLGLRGATVVLLGCDTGNDSHVGRTGTPSARSLAATVAAAGGRGTIATLWPIDDRAAAEFAAALYSASPAIPTAETVALAKRKLALRYPSAPHRWAGFVWFGNPYA